MPARAPMRAAHARWRFTPDLLESHSVANRLLPEDAAHFWAYAETTDVVHVYGRADTGAPVGFQFWGTAPMNLPGFRAVLGGKLRVYSSARKSCAATSLARGACGNIHIGCRARYIHSHLLSMVGSRDFHM